MKLFKSLRMRFQLSIILLLILLIVTILLIVEQREVRSIYEEQIIKGVLRAKYIATINSYSFTLSDTIGVEESFKSFIDMTLVYIVIFDKFNSHFASSQFAKSHSELIQYGKLGENVTPNSYAWEPKRIEDKSTKQVYNILEVEVPIFYGEESSVSTGFWGSIKLGLSYEEGLSQIRETRLVLALIGIAGLLIGIVGATVLARRITGPLHELVDGTVRISRGDFTERIEIHSQDEIGELAKSFNEMSRRLLRSRKRVEAANEKLIQAEKLASIGRMSAGIAHEIRNPLTSVKLNIQKVFGGEGLGESEKSHLEISQEAIRVIEQFIKDLLNFTRPAELKLDWFSIETIVDESIKMVSDSLELKDIQVKNERKQDLPLVKVDADKMKQVFINLLRNAHDAVCEGGSIRTDISVVDERSQRMMKVEIIDDGCGIPDKDLNNVFEPYYTTKASGFGLGLANAKKIVEQHKGQIRAQKNARDGVTFEVLIPIEEEK